MLISILLFENILESNVGKTLIFEMHLHLNKFYCFYKYPYNMLFMIKQLKKINLFPILKGTKIYILSRC